MELHLNSPIHLHGTGLKHKESFNLNLTQLIHDCVRKCSFIIGYIKSPSSDMLLWQFLHVCNIASDCISYMHVTWSTYAQIIMGFIARSKQAVSSVPPPPTAVCQLHFKVKGNVTENFKEDTTNK